VKRVQCKDIKMMYPFNTVTDGDNGGVYETNRARDALKNKTDRRHKNERERYQ
jgi:hypothetical protein